MTRHISGFCCAPPKRRSATDGAQPKKISADRLCGGLGDRRRAAHSRRDLRELGYEGQNIVIDYRHHDRDFERLPDVATELLALKIDVLVAVTTNAALAAKKSTATVPIVFMGVTDPVAAGLVQSLAQPGGNSTGITNMAAVLAGKRLEFLKVTVPDVTRVAVLWDPKARLVPQWV
jgi:putative ABC transport system substrate-binding protein